MSLSRPNRLPDQEWPWMKNTFGLLLRPVRRRFAVLGLLGALVVTVAWWFIVARGVWLAVEWASA